MHPLEIIHRSIKRFASGDLIFYKKELTLQTDDSYLIGFVAFGMKIELIQRRLVRWQGTLLSDRVWKKIKYSNNFIPDTVIVEWKQ